MREQSPTSEPSPYPSQPLTPDQPPEPPESLKPVTADQRLASLDVLRGVAVLGILTMNIVAFGLPFPAYTNPLKGGGFEGLNWLTWLINHLFFEIKFMTIFSILFGAGLMLLHQRAEAKGTKLFGVFYRRCFWLMIIGLLHGFFLWFGDILFGYAICGFLIYPFRRRSPRTLLIVGLLVMLVPIPLFFGFGYYGEEVREQAIAAQANKDQGRDLTEEEKQAIEAWKGMGRNLDPTEEQLEEERVAYRGSYMEALRFRMPVMVGFMLMGTLQFVIWRAGGLMLIGMALMKWGILSAARTSRFYSRLAIAGLIVGLPLVGLSASVLDGNRFDFFVFAQGGFLLNYVGSVFLSLAYIALIMLAYQARWLPKLQDRLAAVGRMAFSNYLMQTVLCTTFFYGYGLGFFATLQRAELYLVVFAVWLLQLIYSPWWLRRYRFGPAEWFWRSLSYWKLQPMRR